MNSEGLLKHLRTEEGFSSVPYKDSKGLLTIGYGTLIEKISKAEAEMLLRSRLQDKIAELDRALIWYQDMPETIQNIMAAMAYQLGTEGLLGFKNTLRFMSMKKFALAADEALRSKWARTDSPARAHRVASIIRKAQ
ncbi:MAG: glycoside hydrolase family protein [Candidatus Anammoxibacter sp.]